MWQHLCIFMTLFPSSTFILTLFFSLLSLAQSVGFYFQLFHPVWGFLLKVFRVCWTQCILGHWYLRTTYLLAIGMCRSLSFNCYCPHIGLLSSLSIEYLLVIFKFSCCLIHYCFHLCTCIDSDAIWVLGLFVVYLHLLIFY